MITDDVLTVEALSLHARIVKWFVANITRILMQDYEYDSGGVIQFTAQFPSGDKIQQRIIDDVFHIIDEFIQSYACKVPSYIISYHGVDRDAWEQNNGRILRIVVDNGERILKLTINYGYLGYNNEFYIIAEYSWES